MCLTYPWHWFGLIGHEPHLWKENGSWREDDEKHANDILKVVLP